MNQRLNICFTYHSISESEFFEQTTSSGGEGGGGSPPSVHRLPAFCTTLNTVCVCVCVCVWGGGGGGGGVNTKLLG